MTNKRRLKIVLTLFKRGNLTHEQEGRTTNSHVSRYARTEPRLSRPKKSLHFS